jgi:hypothetical protein
LTALGADEVLMHPMGMLGPTDPTVTNDFNPINERQPGQLLGISVEDVASYMALVKDDVGIRHEDELVQAFLALAEKVHPLALGNVKRSTSQSRMMGEKLLKTRKAQDLDEHDIAEIIGKLSSQLFYHGHPISRREAREDLGLAFVRDAPGDVESAMWQLFEFYEEDLHLNDPFNFLHEEIRIANGPLPTPPPGPIPGPGIQYRTTRLGAYKSAYVESELQCDLFEHTLEANVNRQWTGDYNGTMTVISSGWTVETTDQP